MPYDPTDPRAQLSTAVAVAGVPRPATYRELHGSEPDEHHAAGGRTWWTRSAALVIAQTEANVGDVIVTVADAEHMLLVLEGVQAHVEHAGDSVDVAETSVVVVPPGESTIRVDAGGRLVRLFAADTVPELAARCANATDYEVADVNVAPFTSWPGPSGGHRLRVYPIAAYPPEPGRLGTIFRCSTVMVNVFLPDLEPRDPSKMSPHHHDDFEQISLQVEGDYVHHMRVAWTPDSTTWRDDEHHHTVAPAVVVIPPPLIHTSQSVGAMRHWLIDVFAPPRRDFSERPGWVLNADDYPMP
jgi:hypothetical protein